MSAFYANQQMMSGQPGRPITDDDHPPGRELAAMPGSVLVEVLAHARQTPIRDGGVVAIGGGQPMSFDEARTFAKARGFRSYLHLLDWLFENYGVPFKGEVVWPNTKLTDG